MQLLTTAGMTNRSEKADRTLPGAAPFLRRWAVGTHIPNPDSISAATTLSPGLIAEPSADLTLEPAKPLDKKVSGRWSRREI